MSFKTRAQLDLEKLIMYLREIERGKKGVGIAELEQMPLSEEMKKVIRPAVKRFNEPFEVTVI